MFSAAKIERPTLTTSANNSATPSLLIQKSVDSGFATNNHLLFASNNKESSSEKCSALTHQNIHLIWLGSEMKPHHVDRTLRWQILNPEFKVMVWANSVYKSAIQKQFSDSKIIVNDVASLKMPDELLSWIEELTKPRNDIFVPNYAAASDIYRISIVDEQGGCYVDTDIKPFNVNTMKIHEELQFHVHALRKSDIASVVSPSIIASNPKSLLTKQSLLLLSKMSKEFNNERYTQMIRNNIASVRMASTFCITGFVIRGALGKIKVNDQPLIEVDNPREEHIPDIQLFDQISSLHSTYWEQSWILTETADPTIRTAIPGVIIDDIYRKPPSSTNAPRVVSEITQKRSEVYGQIDSVALEKKNSIPSPQHT